MMLSNGFLIFVVLTGIFSVIPQVSAVEIAAEQVVQSSRNLILADERLQESGVKVSKDEAKRIAGSILKNFFDIEIDDKHFQTEIVLRQDDEISPGYIWQIEGHMYDYERSINIDVVVDANNRKIKRFSKHEYVYQQEQPMIATMTEAQAKKIGEDFIKSISPEAFKQVKLTQKDASRQDNGGQSFGNYHFRYMREINGIPFDRDYIAVEIDGVNGKVRSYAYRWDDTLVFPVPEDVITQEKAYQLFKEKMDITLCYIPFTHRCIDAEPVRRVKLVYTPVFSYGNVLDAESGKMIDRTGKRNMEQRVKDLSQNDKENLVKKAKPIRKSGEEIDNGRARQVINQKIKELFGNDYKIESIRYVDRENYWEPGDKRAWSAHFIKKGGSRSMYDYGGRMMIDAMTEQLISVYTHRHEESFDKEFEPKITWEQAYDKAIRLIAMYFPDRLKEIETEQPYPNHVYARGKDRTERRICFRFHRRVNGLAYMDHNIVVSFDSKTGEVMELSCNWDEDLVFPDGNAAITEEEAQEILFGVYEPELAYTAIRKIQDGSVNDMEIKLVYRLQSTTASYSLENIDALTGRFINDLGEKANEPARGFEQKIKGHWAEKELSILASQGVIDAEAFQADQSITVIAFIKMLVRAKGYHDYIGGNEETLKFQNITKENENYRYLQLAVEYGFIENKEGIFKAEAKITREEMIEKLVKFLGYDRLAKAKDLFVLNFEDSADVSAERIGYVAIGKGLDIVGESNGYFRPKDNATMAEAAAAVYKVLDSTKAVR